MKADRLLTWVETGLWGLALIMALAFNAVKLRNWLLVDDPAVHSDFAVFYLAALTSRLAPLDLYRPEAWQALSGLDIYVGGPYVYLPSFAWLISPLTYLPYDGARWVWFWLNVTAAAVTCYLVTRIWREPRVALAGALCWLLLPSTLDTLYLGNVNLALALLMTAGLYGWMRDGATSQAFGGAAAGLASALKLFPAVLFLPAFWGWDKRRYGLGFLSSILIVTAVGWAALPSAVWQQYVELLLASSRSLAPTTLSPLWNQSVWAFWEKLSYSGDVGLSLGASELGVVTVRPQLSGSLARALGLASAVAIAAVTAYTLVRIRFSQHRRYTMVWALLLLFSLIISPVTWTYYAAVIAPVLPALWEARAGLARWWRLALPVGYLLIVAQRGMTLLLERFPTMLFSSLMFLGLMLWWLAIVHRIMKSAAHENAHAATKG